MSTKRQTSTGAYAGTAYFFRLAIRNRGNTAARDVQVFLDSVEQIVNGKPKKVAECTPMNLLWSVEFPSNTGGHVLGAGTYLVRIILAAANCRPRYYKLEVIFSGSWFNQEDKMFDVGFKMHAV